MLQQLDAGDAAVSVVHEPADAETELPREIDGAIRRERERGDAEAVHLIPLDSRVSEHAHERVGEERFGCRVVRRMARIRRLGGADDSRPHYALVPIVRASLTNPSIASA